MKIAFLSLSYGAVERGAETFISEVSKRLLKSGYRVDIIAAKKPPAKRFPMLWRFFIDPHGIQVFLFSLKSLPRIWREKYDVVLPIDGGWQSALVRLVTWLYGGKMVISGQSGKGWDDRNNLWCFPDVFVAISSQLAKWAKGVNPFVRVEYIPNGVDLDKFKSTGQKMKFNLEKPIILCVGALTGEKRIDLAIKAVAKLEQGSLVVIGDGPLKENLLKLGKRSLEKRFFLTKVPYKKMPEVYRGTDLFTLPSPWFRAFEIVILEAMAVNIPVVVNNDPIRHEIVGEAGLFVDPENLDEYTQALKNALKTDFGDKPRRQAEKFSWDKIASQYEEIMVK